MPISFSRILYVALSLACVSSFQQHILSLSTSRFHKSCKIYMQKQFSELEVESCIASLKRTIGSSFDNDWDWGAISQLITDTAHKPHKDWSATEKSADKLAELIGGPDDILFRHTFHRVLGDGNWEGALQSIMPNEAEQTEVNPTKRAKYNKSSAKPWVVLITGLNGIRKSTSVYQPWFKEVLHQALGDDFNGSIEELPSGNDSFFRQLDFMIATLANEEFRKLYGITDLIEYSRAKAEIFVRYRTLAEMLGVLLMKEAKKKGMNMMVETSGRDIAMFRYIDHLFPEESLNEYRKLVVHFTINDITFAEKSVDIRMQQEMQDGQTAKSILDRCITDNTDTLNSVRAIIKANAGGPYGSEVLQGVQTDSDAVWRTITCPTADTTDKDAETVGRDWYKASIHINAYAEKDWEAHAVSSKTSDSSNKIFTFEKRN
eukprot:CAMPEP_0182436910 /NCGR_PEP_ID=MMETSP1167-20130531/84369_1 /TAXON_ID=2988 /ORGANISM="Mallomonas Sp, Strain CCMP3275" /LENGTH=431 /DNA_ID=CAMNT_0024629591 /DNA_START=1 /DNA_END=1296 /DNA_ORIENTATION=+